MGTIRITMMIEHSDGSSGLVIAYFLHEITEKCTFFKLNYDYHILSTHYMLILSLVTHQIVNISSSA